jgi:glutathione S-transferase
LFKLYDSAISGNCYKVRLLLSQLELPFERIPVDVNGPGPRPDELLRLSPTGSVPLLVEEDGRATAESNAILWRLAGGTPLLPDEPAERLETLRWLFFEQNAHEPRIAVNRNLIAYRRVADRYREVIEFNHVRGEAALDAMERHLTQRDSFVGGRYTIADIALYAYTHVAPEGGFDLNDRPAVLRWLERVRTRPRYVPIDA